jgi:hypothetical protein
MPIKAAPSIFASSLAGFVVARFASGFPIASLGSEESYPGLRGSHAKIEFSNIGTTGIKVIF